MQMLNLTAGSLRCSLKLVGRMAACGNENNLVWPLHIQQCIGLYYFGNPKP